MVPDLCTPTHDRFKCPRFTWNVGLVESHCVGKARVLNGSAITHRTLPTTKTELSGNGLAHLSQGIGTSIKMGFRKDRRSGFIKSLDFIWRQNSRENHLVLGDLQIQLCAEDSQPTFCSGLQRFWSKLCHAKIIQTALPFWGQKVVVFTLLSNTHEQGSC